MFLKFYGMTTQPFGVTPDPRFLYFGKSHREVWASLTYGIEEGRGFMALIAHPGMGKTTLLLQLLDQYRTSTRSAFIFQPLSGSADFMRALLADLGIQSENCDLGPLTKQLNEVLLSELQQNRQFLLVLDEAQNLDDSILETIRGLSNFETPKAKLMQIILAGQPQLADKLGRWELTQLRQRISILTGLEPFTFEDVERYIRHRLRTAGHPGPDLFTRRAIKEVSVLSGGIPRNINDLCFHALSIGYTLSRRTIDESIVREAACDLSLGRLGSKANRPRQASSRPISEMEGPAVGAKRSDWGEKDIGSMPIEPPAPYLSTGPSSKVGSRPQMPHWLMASLVFIATFLLVSQFLASSSGRSPAPIEQSLGNLGRRVEALLGGAESTSAAAQSSQLLDPSATSSATPRNDIMASEEVIHANDHPSSPGGKSPEETDPGDVPAKSPHGGIRPADESPSYTQDEADSPLPGRSSTAPSRGSEPLSPKSRKQISHLASMGELVVSSDVPRATIYLNGATEPGWTTPFRFSLQPGIYRVSLLKPGYEPTNNWVNLRQRTGSRLFVQMGSSRDVGGLVVITEPAGLQVYIDGLPNGISETYAELSAGSHVLRITPPPGREPYVGTLRIRPGMLLKKIIRWPANTASRTSVNSEPLRPS